MALDHSLLREKELEQQQIQLQHRQQEMAESRLLREKGQLPPTLPPQAVAAIQLAHLQQTAREHQPQE